MVIVDRERRFLWANRAHPSVSMEQLLRSRIDDFEMPDTLPRIRAALEEGFRSGNPVHYLSHYHVDGETYWCEVRAAYMPEDDAMLLVTRDTTETAIAKQHLEQSLLKLSAITDEQALLLKEIHHRVKNNLQVVASMLALQSAGVDDRKAHAALETCRDRVRTIALVHECLCEERNPCRVPFHRFLVDLTSRLLSGLGEPSLHELAFEHVADVQLPMDLAVPCGLIVNELVVNALRHAFRRGPGRLTLSLRCDGETATLTISDNGTGIDVAKTTSHVTLGWRIVRTLVRQIRGRLTIAGGNGTRVCVTFPMPGNENSAVVLERQFD